MTWPTKKLGEVCEKLTLKKAVINSWPYIEIGDINIESKAIVLKDKKSIKGAILAPKDSVLISRVRPTRGAIIFIDKDYVASSAFTILKAKKSETSSRFLFHWLSGSKSFLNYLQRKQKGSNYPSVREKDVLAYKISLPPLKIQKQIVERLDKIAEAQKLNNELIQKADELFQSLLHKELDVTDKDWPLKDIGDMINFSQLGLVRSKDKQSDDFEFNYIKMDNISLAGDLLLDKLVKVNATSQEVQKFKLEKGDFIFNTRNTPELVGKATIFDIKNPVIFLFNNNILRLRFKDEFMAEFINYYLHTKDGIKKLNSKKRGTTSVSAIYQGDLFSIRIPIPSLETQKQIVAKLSAAQEYKNQLLAQKSKLKELFESVLNKAFKGQL